MRRTAVALFCFAAVVDCAGGDAATTPTAVERDPLAAARGAWELREVLYGQRQPPGVACGADPHVTFLSCSSADTQSVTITTGTITIGATVPGTRSAAADSSALETVVAHPSLTAIAYVGSSSSARASCSGKSLACWTQLTPLPVAPALLSDTFVVVTARHEVGFAFWFFLNKTYATGQALAFRNETTMLFPLFKPLLAAYDSGTSGVFSLRKL